MSRLGSVEIECALSDCIDTGSMEDLKNENVICSSKVTNDFLTERKKICLLKRQIQNLRN